MSLSTFCHKHRSRSKKLFRNVTISALIISGVLHFGGAIALYLLNKNNAQAVAEPEPEPIEFQVIEPPEPEIAKIKPEQVVEPQPQPEPEPIPEPVQEAVLSAKQFLPDPTPEPVAPQPKAPNLEPAPSSSQIPQGIPGGQSLGKTLTGSQGSGFGTGDQGTGEGEQLGSPTGSGTAAAQGTGDGNGQGSSRISLKCVSNCQPVYPSSISEKIPGKVMLEFTVETDGSVSDAKVFETSGNGALDQAGVQDISRMRFSPPNDGRSRRVKMLINYQLPN
ncbi:energy transducer TonB [Crocosphaera sp. Alani8]|uniref:energy transducer TonB n=1 Tax=Crocosphaera sp. Alani8 TaxID=3038952 RepID=UPI00313EF1DF